MHRTGIAFAIAALAMFLYARPAAADTPTPTPPPGAGSCTAGWGGTWQDAHSGRQGVTIDYTGGTGMAEGYYDGDATANNTEWHVGTSTEEWAEIMLPLDHPIWVGPSDSVTFVAYYGGMDKIVTFIDADGASYMLVTGVGWPSSNRLVTTIADGGYREIVSVEVSWPYGYSNQIVGFGLNGICAPTETATPAPTPTVSPSATSFLVDNELCNSSPITTTATPTPQATPSPFAAMTSTPGGPTPVPSITPTNYIHTGPKPTQPFDYASTADFTAGLQPWTTSATDAHVPQITIYTEWSNADGPDGHPGVAQLGAFSAADYLYPNETSITDTLVMPAPVMQGADPLNLLVLPLPEAVSRAINVTGRVKSINPAAKAGNHLWLMVWYLDPGGGTPAVPAWVLKPAYLTEVSYTWGTWSARVIPDADPGGDRAQSATAIGLTWYITNPDNPTDATWDESVNGLLLDDIQVTIGDQADAALPICAGGGGGNGPFGNPDTKVCTVHEIPIDIYATRCIQPTGLDVSAWLNYWGCHIEYFFTWVDENTVQQQAMLARGNTVEPIGTIAEFPAIIGEFKDLIWNIGVVNSNNFWAEHRLDFGSLLDWHALDTPPTFTAVMPDMSYLNNCNGAIANISQVTKTPACWVIETIRMRLSFINLVQWFLDAGAVISLILYIRDWVQKHA